MATYSVGVLIGSLSSQSINRLLARALMRLAPPELSFCEVAFKDLPLYSADHEANFPPAAQALKDALAAVDAVLFVTPEYNRSIPGGLKNAIDWASRPLPGEPSFACFKNKAAALVSASPGALGGLRGLPQLATLLRNLQMIVLPNQRAISAAHEAFLEDGSMKDRSAAEGLRAVGADLARFLAMTPAG